MSPVRATTLTPRKFQDAARYFNNLTAETMFDLTPEDITEGSLVRALTVLAAPLLVQNLVQVAQQTVDLFWVGRLGEQEVAAVGFNFPLVGLLTIALVGIFVGTQVLVSQRVGADDGSGANRAAIQGIVLAFGSGAVIAIGVYQFAPAIVRSVSLGRLDPQVTELAASYLAVWGFALVPAGVSDALEAGFVGWGDSRASLYINVTAVLLNIVLDPFLILGWGPFEPMGVEGAALATVLGYAGGAILAIGLAVSGIRPFALTRQALAVRLDDIRELVDIGAPSAGEHTASQSVRVVLIGIVAAVGGPAGLAAYAIGARVASIAFIPATGLQQAAQSVIGQNLGAGNPLRARRATWAGVGIAAGTLTVIGIAQWFVPAPLARLFVPDIGAQALDLSVEYLRILAYGYPAIGATYLLLAGFNGARRTRTSMVSTLLQYWAVRLPVAVGGITILSLGVIAVFWAVTISNIVAAIGIGLYYWHATNNGMLSRAADTATAD